MIIYKTTKKHNQQKVDCKSLTDKHIKTLTKNLQFSDQNSSWKIANLQFSHDREITRLRYTHHKQAKVVCYYIEKESWRFAKWKSSRLSYSEVVSLPLESILSKISRYDADLSDSVVSFISSCENYDCWWIAHHRYI